MGLYHNTSLKWKNKRKKTGKRNQTVCMYAWTKEDIQQQETTEGETEGPGQENED